MVAGETIDEHLDGAHNQPTLPVDPDRIDTLPPTAVSATAAPATALGSGYLLDREIGRGATGRVWRGRRRSDGTPVAVKVLREDLALEPDVVVRFLRQRTVLRALDHPHLVRIHDLVAEGEQLAVVMDLVDGEDLRRMAGRQALRPSQALALLGQVAEALAAVHAAGVVHRDVKPENVLVQWRDGSPYALLTDFGLAGAATGPTDLTRLSVLMGTPAYLAPELVTGRPAEPASDVYALGITAYELLAGQRPFLAPNQYALLNAHVECEPERPAGMATPVWEHLHSMLAKDPATRPTAAAVSAGFAALRNPDGLPAPIPPPTPPEPAPVPSPVPLRLDPSPVGGAVDEPQPTTGATRPAAPAPPAELPRRRRGWLIATLVATALLGAGAGLWSGRPDPAPSQPDPGPPQESRQAYHLHITATSQRPGQIQLGWDDAVREIPGFELYIVFRDGEVYEDGSDLEQPFLITPVDDQTPHCWRVVAVVTSADSPEPPFAERKETCRKADGKPEN